MGKDGVGSGKGRRAGVVKKAKKQESNRGFILALVGVAVLGAAAIGYVASRSGGSARVTEIDPNLPSVEAVGYVIGSPNAPIEVLEFADFECPGCGQFALLTAPDVKQRLVQTGQIRLRFMDFPLPQHLNSITASLAAACANAQGKFWEMHDGIFANQHRWATQATDDPLPIMKEIAQGIQGLDANALEQCVQAQTYLPQVKAHLDEGQKRGVSQTPSFIIGGKLIPGAISYDRFKAYVDTALAQANATR